MIEWTDALSVSNKDIDNQHKRLVELINKIHTQIQTDNLPGDAEAALNNLAAYAEEHFRLEEQLMLESAYPGYMDHKQKHCSFSGEIKSFSKKLESSKNNAQVLKEIYFFMQSWFVTHVKETDKLYAPYIRDKNINK